MRLRNTSTPLVLVASAFMVATFAACSGIDGLPETPVDPSARDAASDAAVVDASVSGAVVDAGGNDASVIDGGVVDSGTVDATVDAAPCVSETDNAFCTRLAKNCGAVTAADNCGVARTVASCGVCSSYYESCGGGNVPNVCGCTPESDWSFCTRTGHSCGIASGADNCGQSRTVASCGGACVDAGPSDAGTVDAGAVDASAVQRWTFTNCTATGATGPTQAQCDTAYAGTNLAGAVSLNAGIQTWTVPATGRYRIVAMGAQGGGDTSARRAGRGAYVQGDFSLDARTSLSIATGQVGRDCGNLSQSSAGGGGGSFVMRGPEALVAAGGGGGAGVLGNCGYCQPDGIGGSTVPGVACLLEELASTSTCSHWYEPIGSGLPPFSMISCEGSDAGGCGACNSGGFGGGVAGARRVPCSGCQVNYSMYGSGGGGGYTRGESGGMVTSRSGSDALAGGGGSSYSSGDNPVNFSGYRAGDGLVIVERLP